VSLHDASKTTSAITTNDGNPGWRDYLGNLPLFVVCSPLLYFLVWSLLVFLGIILAIPYKLISGEALPYFPDPDGHRFSQVVLVLTSFIIGICFEARAHDAVETRRKQMYHSYLESPEWRSIRGQALQRAEGRCQVCNAANGLQAHHRTYRRLGGERIEDVTILCRRCHELFHTGGRMPDSSR
jgi:hypothetical protein